MAQFDIKSLTAIGANDLARALNGERIAWDYMQASTDYFSNDVANLTTLTNVIKNLNILSAKQVADGQFDVTSRISSSDVSEQTTIRTYGLFAHFNTEKPALMAIISDKTGDVLYPVSQATNPQDLQQTMSLVFPNPDGKPIPYVISSSGYAMDTEVLHKANDETVTGTKTFQRIKISNDKFPSLVQTDGQYITLDGGNSELIPANDSKVVHTTGDETIAGQKKFDTDPTDSAGNAYAKTVDVNHELDKKVNVADMRKPASDVAGIEEVSTLQTQVDNSAVGTNMLLNTGGLSSDWTLGQGVTVDTSQKPVVLHYPIKTLTNNLNLIAQQQLNDGLLQPSTTYTASFYAKGTGSFAFYCFPSVPNISWWSDARTEIKLTSEYKLYTVTFTTNYNISGNKIFVIRQEYSSSDTDQNTVEAYVYGFKLEKGSKATDWCPNPDDKVNVADMRKPASDVAGIEEVNAKQDKLTITPADDSKVVHTTDTSNWQKQAMFNPGDFKIDVANSTTDFATLLRNKYDKAGVVYIRDDVWPVVDSVVICEGGGWWYAYGINSDGNFVYRRIRASDDTGWVLNADDSKVAHLSGANNFDTTPTVNNNPLLLASSLPSDLARTSQQTNFTAGLQSGGVSVATSDDLKSVEKSAWHQLDSKYISISNYTDHKGLLLYKINESNTTIDFIYSINGMNASITGAHTIQFDFSSIVKGLKYTYQDGDLIGISGFYDNENNNQNEIRTIVSNVSGAKVSYNFPSTSLSGYNCNWMLISSSLSQSADVASLNYTELLN